MAYENYMTFYEKSAYIDAVAVCGNTVVAYSSDPKIDTEFMAQECQKIVRKNGYKVDVKILKELRPFLDRLDSMNARRESLEEGIKFEPDERYPELSRNELICHTIPVSYTHLIGYAYRYAEQIEPYCLHGSSTAKLGIYLSKDEISNEGTAKMLLEDQVDFDIVYGDNFEEFDTIIFPDCAVLEEDAVKKLEAFKMCIRDRTCFS